jgi:protein TonB
MPHNRQHDARRPPTTTIAVAASLALHTFLFATFLWIGHRDRPVNTAGIVVVFAAGEGAPLQDSDVRAEHERHEQQPPPQSPARPLARDTAPTNAALPTLPIIALGEDPRLPPAPEGAIENTTAQAPGAAPLERAPKNAISVGDSIPHSSAAEAPATPSRPGASRGVSITHAAAPTYPASAIRLRQEGLVEVEVRVRADGRVAEARLRRSSGHSALDAAALDAARAARFQPALSNGQPTEGRIVIPFHFQLQSSSRVD